MTIRWLYQSNFIASKLCLRIIFMNIYIKSMLFNIFINCCRRVCKWEALQAAIGGGEQVQEKGAMASNANDGEEVG